MLLQVVCPATKVPTGTPPFNTFNPCNLFSPFSFFGPFRPFKF